MPLSSSIAHALLSCWPLISHSSSAKEALSNCLPVGSRKWHLLMHSLYWHFWFLAYYILLLLRGAFWRNLYIDITLSGRIYCRDIYSWYAHAHLPHAACLSVTPHKNVPQPHFCNIWKSLRSIATRPLPLFSWYIYSTQAHTCNYFI